MAFTLPPLPYAYNALEPHIDAQTMRIHHDKHHDTYVNNLNAALEAIADLQKQAARGAARASSTSLPEAIRTRGAQQRRRALPTTRCSGRSMAPGRRQASRPASWPTPSTKAFGGFGQFKEQFAKAALGRFGSGWAWLVGDGTASSPSRARPTRTARS